MIKSKYGRQESLFSSMPREQGSALLSALIFTLLIGVASVSYLKLASSEHRAAVRATLYASSLNLAESGIEMGVEALSKQQTSGSTWKKTESNYLQDGGFTGDVSLVVLNANSANPTIYAEGVISGHPAGVVRKQVRVELSSGFRPFEKGFSARDGITFSGNNVVLDSWNSRYGPYNSFMTGTYIDAAGNLQTIPSDYGVSGYNKNDDIFVASDRINTENTSAAVDAGNADIYGYVTVSPTSSVDIGPNGVVTTYNDGSHDDSRVLSDFYADFPPIESPQSFDTDAGNISTVVTLGTAMGRTTYSVDAISLGGNSSTVLNIVGDVTFLMKGVISITGQASINITAGSRLTIYTGSDVNIAGNGVANSNFDPASFLLYGTAPENIDSAGSISAAQSISITGNGQLQSVVYAPTADISLTGGGNSGQVLGGVVGLTARITGNSSFHFDEALREIIFGGGVFTIDSWLEMTGATIASTPVDLSDY